jgi:hypothetical protein
MDYDMIGSARWWNTRPILTLQPSMEAEMAEDNSIDGDSSGNSKPIHPPGFLIDIGPKSRMCKKCGISKSSDEFYKPSASIKNGKTYLPKFRAVCKTCTQEHFKKWVSDHPERSKEIQKSIRLKETYGMSIEEHDAIMKSQDRRCAICGNEETTKHNSGNIRALAVDHCHETGKIRGLLCNMCNLGIGKFKEDPTLLRAAADYIEKYRT